MRVRKTFHAMPHEPLMRLLKFDARDLEANRQGRLTTMQKQRIRWQQWAEAAVIMVTTLGMLAVGWISITKKPAMPTGVQLSLLVILFVVPVAAVLFLYQGRTRRILRQGKVAMTHGPVTLKSPGRGHTINTPDKSLWISLEATYTFQEGTIYTLYYLPEMNHLLSAEAHTNPKALQTRRPRTLQRHLSPPTEKDKYT